MKSIWHQTWLDKGWRLALLIGILFALLVVYFLPDFFWLIENKPGERLHDPLLELIGPAEVSAITFAVLYSLVIAGIYRLTRQPYRFVQVLHAYTLLLLLRMVTMYSITLEPPGTIIPLIDPVTQGFYPDNDPFLKDLFFSGHTSTSVLFALAVGPGKMRWLIGMGAVIVGFLVLLQHVHYTMDVLAAPFFATLAWVLARHTVELCGASTSFAIGETRRNS